MTPTPRTPPKVPRPVPAPLTASARIARLAESVEAARARDELRASVDEFWDTDGARTPLVEPADSADERVVTFLWRDPDAEEVLLFVNRLTDERRLDDSLMRRVPGTDVWHLSYRMGSDWRASYSFLPRYPGQTAPWRDDADQVVIRGALDRGRADPRNPRTNLNRSGVVQSVVEGPDAPAQSWLERRPDVPRGTVGRSEGPGGRMLWTYLPPGNPDGPLPLLIALDGEVWIGPQDLPATLDNLVHDGRIPPLAAVLVDSGGRERRWADLDEDGRFEDYLAGELLDWARAGLPVTDDRSLTIVAGQSLGGLTALKTVLQHPDRIAAALSQSASLWQQDLAAAIEGGDLAGVRAYVEVGTQEWVLLQPNRDVAERLRDAGADVRFAPYNGGHDYACWRGGIADGLQSLLARPRPAR